MTGMSTGGPLKAFDGGWALIPFKERVHHWRLCEEQAALREHLNSQGTFWRSACGTYAVTTSHLPALHPGNMLVCKRCTKIAAALSLPGAAA